MRRPRQAPLEFVNVVMKAPGRLGRNRETATWGLAGSGTKSQRNGRRRRRPQVGREDARHEANIRAKGSTREPARGHSGGPKQPSALRALGPGKARSLPGWGSSYNLRDKKKMEDRNPLPS